MKTVALNGVGSAVSFRVSAPGWLALESLFSSTSNRILSFYNSESNTKMLLFAVLKYIKVDKYTQACWALQHRILTENWPGRGSTARARGRDDDSGWQ